ncbi:MAG: PD-(D/E)XK nuclease family protein, partial [Lachnospiraceae bacterium]|nr:PD-(D/E)XK nuclease family protein [Lachnospiraceae bacterium]
SYNSVCGLLKCSMLPFTKDETDRFDIYISAMGIRGKSRYNKPFEYGRDAQEAEMVRERLMEMLSVMQRPFDTAKDITENIYDFLTAHGLYDVLREKADEFENSGQLVLSKEYDKIYESVMDLFDQIHELIGDDDIDVKEYLSIFEAGVSEIRIGTIPQSVDQVMVGDMQRTRLEPVRALFFLGVNDGIIPQRSISGGILSDAEKEFLRQSGMELSPGPKEKMYEQRLYLYHNMTKPSDLVVLSYSALDKDGKSLPPSYLINEVCSLFPDLKIRYCDEDSSETNAVSRNDARSCMARLMGRFMSDDMDTACRKNCYSRLRALAGAFREDSLVSELSGIAAYRYIPRMLSPDVTTALYDKKGSISRLELMASCPYAHFLKYGLLLSEKEEFGFERVDSGNIYHAVLEQVMSALYADGKRLEELDDEQLEAMVHETLQRVCEGYGWQILFNSKRNEHKIVRMERVLLRTLKGQRFRLSRGAFKPVFFERTFESNAAFLIRGKIDRVDLAEDDDRLYVKVVDYKSSSKQLEITRIGYGLSMQLPIYLSEASGLVARDNPDKKVLPAAMFYIPVKDPVLSGIKRGEEGKSLRREMRPKGMFLSDQAVLSLLDSELAPGVTSDVIHAALKNDGMLTGSSQSATPEQMQALIDHAGKMAGELLKDIQKGDIAVRPVCTGSTYDSCSYCPYSGICGFDPRIGGYEKTQLEPLELDDIVSMQEQSDGIH